MAHEQPKAEFNELPKFDRNSFEHGPNTYVWKVLSKDSKSYVDCVEFSDFLDDDKFKGRNCDNCVVLDLNMNDTTVLALRQKYFERLFEQWAFINSDHSPSRFARVILPLNNYVNIFNTIRDYNLVTIHDLLVEVIAISQDIFLRASVYWDGTKDEEIFRTVRKETEKAIKIIEQSGVDYKSWRKYEEEKRPRLQYVSFKFNTGTINIHHEWLAREFILHMMNYYNELDSKDWRQELDRFPELFKVEFDADKFKMRLAKSYYNLLAASSFFDLSESPYPNKLMRCICALLENSSIPIEDADDVKLTHIRNWIQRTEWPSE